jgi:uncharacterized membrane protein YdjX (TVP38/TMEM64 family)
MDFRELKKCAMRTDKKAKKRLAIWCRWPIIPSMLLETAAGTPAP